MIEMNIDEPPLYPAGMLCGTDQPLHSYKYVRKSNKLLLQVKGINFPSAMPGFSSSPSHYAFPICLIFPCLTTKNFPYFISHSTPVNYGKAFIFCISSFFLSFFYTIFSSRFSCQIRKELGSFWENFQFSIFHPEIRSPECKKQCGFL